MDFTKMSEEDLLADSDEDSSSSSSAGENQQDASNKLVPAFDAGKSAASVVSSSDSEDSNAVSEEDEEMDVDEDALLAELSSVNDKLGEQPYSYDLYLDKIKILKSIGDLDALRNCREKMSSLYPLSPSLWLDWIQDEQKMISSDEEKQRVFSLLDRAVKDYSAVEVWLEYINFSLSNMGESSGVEKCREVFEKALGNCGLHVAMGSLIWDTYRDFEAALLGTQISPEDQSLQEKRYIALCRRQLSVPLLDMQSSYSKIKEKLEEIDEPTQTAYEKAKERLKELQEWEAKLIQVSDDTLKLQVYKDYIAVEKKIKSNPARVQCLYERALTEIPLDSTLWIEYIDYLSKNLKVPELILTTAERAARNCPWIISIWTKYMSVVETFVLQQLKDQDQGDEPLFEKMKNVFENAIVYCGGIGDGAGTLWLKYLEFLKRRVDLSSPHQSIENTFETTELTEIPKIVPKPLVILRKTFTAAVDHLLQLVQEPNDYISQILQFQARFEALLASSITKEVHSFWKDILQRGYSANFRVWNHYIIQQLKYDKPEPKKLRIEFTRAMNLVRDDPQSMADLWLNFERDYGDINTLASAEEKIAKALANAVLIPSTYSYEAENNYNAATTSAVTAANYRNNFDRFYGKTFEDKSGRGQSGRTPGGFDKGGRKRKWEEQGAQKNAYSPKKGRPSFDSLDGDRGSGSGGFKVPAVPISKAKDKKDPAPSSGGQDSEKNIIPQPPEPVKHDHSKDPRTVFVSNLDFSTDEKALKEFFISIGEIEEVRLVRDFKGRSKGFGYVFFVKETAVKSALEMDRKPLGNRPIFVSKCDPDKSTRQRQFKYAQAIEKNKIFVKGLPFSMTKDELKEMFEKFGPLKDCRLVTYRNGHSKGIAFVEFEKEAHASAAIMKSDGITIQDKVISVAISNPPSKDQPRSQPFISSRIEPNQRRGRNVFVPRIVQANTSLTTGTNKDKESDKGSGNEITIEPLVNLDSTPTFSGGVKKSNDDFRKLFMKPL